MTEQETPYPTRAYDLLEDDERRAVEEYVRWVVGEQRARNQRIDLALNLPIPSDHIKRSRGVLLRPVVRAALAERILQEAENTDISPDRVIREYAKIAFSDVTDYLKPGLYGDLTLKDFKDIPADKTSAIKSIEANYKASGAMNVKVVMHDKHAALRTLSDMMGITTPEQPTPLKEYVKQEIRNAQNTIEFAPEAEYVELLEHVNAKES